MGLFRMLMCKKQYETAFLRSLFLCKSSHLRVVTSVLPLSIIKFFPSLSARAAAHFGCMVGRYFLVMPKTRWNISLNGERPRPTKSRPGVKCSGFNFARGSESPVRSLVTSAKRELSTIGRTGRCSVAGFVYGNYIIFSDRWQHNCFCGMEISAY